MVVQYTMMCLLLRLPIYALVLVKYFILWIRVLALDSMGFSCLRGFQVSNVFTLNTRKILNNPTGLNKLFFYNYI